MDKSKEQNKARKQADDFYTSSKEEARLLKRAKELRNEKSLYCFQGAQAGRSSGG